MYLRLPVHRSQAFFLQHVQQLAEELRGQSTEPIGIYTYTHPIFIVRLVTAA